MPITILIVDDSHFFQRVLTEIINENKQFTVIGVANNGREAIEKVKSLNPDIVTMDYEMPMMDGVTAVREIMSTHPLPILMLSSMTFSGAKITIDALEAGAAEFMTKNFAEISGKGSVIKKRLYDTLLALSQSRSIQCAPNENNRITCTTVSDEEDSDLVNPLPTQNQNNNSFRTTDKTVISSSEKISASTSIVNRTSGGKSELAALGRKVKMIAIGASTGGPLALSELLRSLPETFRFPILIIQHMPENFTLAFSQRLNKQCNIEVKEAEDGDYIQPGRALLAPGGKQMIIDKKNKNRVKVMESKADINYKPCIDISFASLSNSYVDSVLGIVLTGMGSDGCDGSRLLTENKSTIWTQNENSCVVYGMPMAVDKANLSSASLDLKEMSSYLISL
jgi:two-component system, chemotaxis family, protein-glutamate methylesterase/glutaminase